MRRSLMGLLVVCATMAVAAATVHGVEYTDPFDGPDNADFWTLRTPGDNDRHAYEDGWFVFDIDANQDTYKRGVDGGPFLLLDPPADDAAFSIETRVNALMDLDAQTNASHTGLIFFNEEDWAYSCWGPYNNADIRLEDVIDQDYRWRAETAIGADPAGGITDDIYLKVEKSGDDLEFFWKVAEGDAWESGGVDAKLGPQYSGGNYKVGLFIKSWAGSAPTRSSFDYFHSPEILGLAVDPQGKAATQWGALKSR
jgi:hypothetical protein